MVISETMLVDVEPTRKQLTMPAYAVSALQSGKIKKMSKGIIAYECLMLANDEYNDSLQRIRSRVVCELEKSLGGLSWQEVVRKIILSREGEARLELFEKCSFEDPEADIGHVEVWFPSSIEREIPRQRYIGQHVTDAIVYTVASPWASRAELIQDVLDLIALARGEAVDESEVSDFVVDVMTGRSNTYSQEILEPLHDAVMGDSPYQPVDGEGVRTDEPTPAVDTSVDDSADESVDGEVPAWAREYEWNLVSPDDELDLGEARELLDEAKQTPAARVPIVFAAVQGMNRYDGGLPMVGFERAMNQTIGSAGVDFSAKTFDSYREEVRKLMRSSGEWAEDLLLLAHTSDVEVPIHYLDDDGSLKSEYRMFVHGDVEAAWESRRNEAMGNLEKIRESLQKLESASTESLASGVHHVQTGRREKFERKETEFEALVEWMDEQIDRL